MNIRTIYSMLFSCILALPLSAIAFPESGTQNVGATFQRAGHGPTDKPVIPEYVQPGSPITANKIVGSVVTSSDGKDIGSVHDLVMNKHGQITHLIVDLKHTDRGHNLIAIPWQLVKPADGFVMNPGKSSLHLIVTKDVVSGAPTIKGRDYPLPHAKSSLELSNHYFRNYFTDRNS